MTWDLSNNLNWEPIERGRTIEAVRVGNSHIAIPTVVLSVNSRVIQVGVEAPNAKPWWTFGGWASQNLAVKPDVGSQFQAFTRTQSSPIFLKQLTLIEFKDWESYPYFLKLDFAAHHTKIYFEVWEYEP